jgi:hypothetical protein
MPRLLLGLVAGLVFGAFAVATMLPMQFADRRAALAGAFFSRLAIGVIIGAAIGSPQLMSGGFSPWITGAAIGMLVSLPDAIITRAYAPILVIGTVGGAAIGWIVGKWGIS